MVRAVGWTAARTNRTGAVDSAGAPPCGWLEWGGQGYWGGPTGARGGAGVRDTTPAVAPTDPGGAAMGAGWGGGVEAQLLVPWQEVGERSCTCGGGGHWGDAAASGQPAEVGLGPRGEARVPEGC